MKPRTLLALLTAMQDEELEKLTLPEGLAGPRGLRGKDGRSFIFEDHKEEIEKLIPIPENGKDGIDGKNFSFQENSNEIQEIINTYINGIQNNLKLNFTDLSEEEVNSLRGSEGLQGKSGKDFIFEEHSEKVQNLVNLYIEEIKEELKLKFDNLSTDNILELRGPRGQKGKSGKDFSFEENKENISELVNSYIGGIKGELTLKFSNLTLEELDQLKFKFEDFTETQLDSLKLKFDTLTEDNKEELKLKFEHLTEENKNELKLKFEDLSGEDKLELKGSRGQRGRQGVQGEFGKDGLSIRGEIGPQGPQGIQGPRGLTGIDGKDAAEITDVEVLQKKEDIQFRFLKDDGEEILTNKIKLPESKGNRSLVNITPFYSYGFSYKKIVSFFSLNIPENQQMLVKGGITIEGELITNGELVIL